jgi:hypothetical protein
MDETARQNALRALQRSMDRRDNGGSTGHERLQDPAPERDRH